MFRFDSEPQHDQHSPSDPTLLSASMFPSASSINAPGPFMINEGSPLTPLPEELPEDHDYASSGHPSVLWTNGWRTILPCYVKGDGSYDFFGVIISFYLTATSYLHNKG